MAGIKDTKIIKGQPHLLTYITPNEVEKLKALGGQETMTPEGIPAYPEFDNYGFSSQADFDSGDVSRSNDPNVRGEGPGQNRVTASQLAATNAKEKEAERQKVLAELSVTPFNRNKPLSKFGLYNNQFQKKQNIKLAQKRAFQKYQDIEKYANIMDDYGLSAEELAEKVAANNTYGYDFSDLDLGKKTLGSNIGTSIEKYRENLYDVNPKTKYGVMQALLDATRKDTQVTAENTLNKARDYRDLAVDPNISREKLEALANRGKLPEQINPPSGGDNNQPFIPINYNTGAAEAIEPYTNDFTYRFGDTQGVGDDVTKGFYAAKGGRAGKAEGGIMGTRARRAMGGIMSRVDQRQGYGFGSIVKSITKPFKSVAKAAGKVLKSDLGKAALIYGGGAMLGSYGAGKGFFSPGMFNPANMGRGLLGTKGVGMAGGTSGLFGKIGLTEGFGALMPTLKGAGVLGLGALGLFGNKAAPNETSFSDRGGRLKNSQGQEGNQAIRDEIYEAYESGDQDRIMQLQKFYGYKLPSLDAVQDMSLPSSLPYPNYAEGGRIGKAEGGLMDLGGMEKDYRAEGGFVPIGEYEKKDDVPARLSVNEFVFTADAVRGAGQGDIDKGAEIMENMMENLENGGTISEESQGKNGAQQMFETSQRLGEVV